eukprot:3326304-Prymnesium_polylepis.1
MQSLRIAHQRETAVATNGPSRKKSPAAISALSDETAFSVDSSTKGASRPKASASAQRTSSLND